MKSSRLGLGAALLTSLILAAVGGFLIGKNQEATNREQRGPATAGFPFGPAKSLGSAPGSDRGSGTGASATEAIDLSGLAPVVAWRKLMDIRDPAAKAGAVRLLLGSMPPKEWASWLIKMDATYGHAVLDDHDPEKEAAHFSTLNTVLQRVVATDPGECLSAILSLNGKLSTLDLVQNIMGVWARRDFRAARQFYEKEFAHREYHGKHDIVRDLIQAMAKTDLQGSLQWAETLADESTKTVARASAFEVVLRTDRKEAINLLMSRPDWSDRPALAELIASDWATSEPGPTLKWAQTLPDDLREPPVKSAFYAWLEKDFDAARAAFDASAPDAKSLMLSTMLEWAPKEQLSELAELVTHEPIAANRVEASGILMMQWVKQDPTAASEWLAQQQPGAAQDRAIAGFVVDWASEHEPQAALEWAGSISEPQLRWRQLEFLAKRYRNSDPAMARTWLNGTTRLSEDERARFLDITGK